MAYTKTTWANDVAVNDARLNNLETQYDEAVAYADTARADNTKEIRAEVVATLTGETPTAGRLLLNGDNGFFYGGDGSAWNLLGGGIDIKSRQYVQVGWTGNTNISQLKTDRVVTLTTPVSDYTKCIVKMHGYAPVLITGNYLGTQITNQIFRCEFYGVLTANDSLTVSIACPDIAVDDNWTGESISLITYWWGCDVYAEIIELDGAKAIHYATKTWTATQASGIGDALPAGSEPTKCVFAGCPGWLVLINSGSLGYHAENLGTRGTVSGSNVAIVTNYYPWIASGAGLGWTYPTQTITVGYYYVETF